MAELESFKRECDLKTELFEYEPKIDLLHEVMGFGHFAEMNMLREHGKCLFLGREHGDIGFNAWLGEPSDVAKERTKVLFKKLSPCSQEQVKVRLTAMGVALKDIGIE